MMAFGVPSAGTLIRSDIALLFSEYALNQEKAVSPNNSTDAPVKVLVRKFFSWLILLLNFSAASILD